MIKKVVRAILAILAVVVGTLAIFVYRGIFWMFATWNHLTMEELVFHLNSPLEGTNQGVIKEFFYSCGIPTIIALVLLAIVFILILVLKKRKIFYGLFAGVLIISIVVIGATLRYAWNTLEISSYKDNQSTYSTFIDDNYVSPADVALTFPEEKRNLIYIYLESMEMTYADEENGGAFSENVIPELTELSKSNENFSGDSNLLNGATALNGATWTAAAMFAQTCGLPLTVALGSYEDNDPSTVLPGIVTLGDILESAGYHQTLLIGSDGNFGGRESYFTAHGNYDIQDYYYYSENGSLPEGYLVWWGYEDNRLFEFAKEELEELSQSDEPFNLTLLTVDTHFEDGYVCDDCPDTYGDNQYANVMACSSKKVAEFVEWVQQQDFYENTTIVISGDHPTMDSDFCEDVDEDYDRKVYTAYINAAAAPEESFFREYTTFDQFPTTLASLGVQIEGERLGLGTNLFSYTQTLTERYGNDTINSELSKQSELLDQLTADVENPDLQVEVEEAKNSATVSVTPYDNRTGKFEVQVSDIKTDMDYRGVRCLAWPEGDAAKKQWSDCELLYDGTYMTSVYAWDYGFETGNYMVQIYIFDEAGNSVLLSEFGGILVE
jgi:phosphoglycerol transferase